MSSGAGKYNKKIQIYKEGTERDKEGFSEPSLTLVYTVNANVKTTKGYTLLKSGSDFEGAHTNFTIRYPKTEITRDMLVKFKGKYYSIEYLNNVNEENIELEMQCKVVVK